jgi:prepilin peptidase CpaA
MHSIHSIALWPTVAVVLVATITDLRSRRIPNWLVLPFLVLGLAASGISMGWSGLGESLLGVLTGVVVLGVFCYLGGMGMGDLKLCAAVGAWIGPSQLLTALVITGLAGGVMALGWVIAGGFFRTTMRNTASLIAGFGKNGIRPHDTIVLENPLSRRMPYAPAIAIGTICSFLGAGGAPSVASPRAATIAAKNNPTELTRPTRDLLNNRRNSMPGSKPE